MLEEVREKIQTKKAEIEVTADPKALSFINSIEKIFNNEDAIRMLSRAERSTIYMYVGYPIIETADIDKQVMDEVNKIYTFVDPEPGKSK